MPFLTQGKTNWKFLSIVIVLAVIVGAGTLLYLAVIGGWPELKKPGKVSFEQLSACNTDSDCILVNHKSCGGIIKISINKEYESLYNSTPKFQDSTGEICKTLGISYNEQKQIVEGQVPSESLCVSNKCVPKYLKDETANWKTYRNEDYGFEIKYPDREDINFIAQGDGEREFLFGSVDCTYESKEATVLGTIRFLPKIEGMIPNIERTPGAPHTAVRKPTEEECDELASRYIISGRFCTNKNLTKYQAYCEEGSETSDYHRYDVFLICDGEDWKGKEGRNKCNQFFNQTLSTFKFLE